MVDVTSQLRAVNCSGKSNSVKVYGVQQYPMTETVSEHPIPRNHGTCSHTAVDTDRGSLFLLPTKVFP